ncbi:glycosyltransferase involved in cell wall biosynthesis [Inhella inkyongensis]|uniref:Glycosyltransferase involved in cell wall biosynthesis n=1 Tax=Inhella inkyongensis TaxID=392593 RepID=A0A840S7T7_9BURK|nr:glycosyltransferase [Inhella inkyongensis]MBB5204499.1 glycosyltransferase involved in cell wall biosynthesis [Inhella inkyongensis]
MKLVLIGDGESPHLLKWARALAPEVELWALSSRGFLPGFDALIPPARRLALGTDPRHAGGNTGLLRALPKVGRWLQAVDADCLHAHYLTSHGTLAWLARRLYGLRARLVGSAWGSDILVTPARNALYRALTRRVLRACSLCTSDSEHMAARMRALGAAEVMVFPFGLEALPPAPGPKQPWRCYANRGLEPIYRPERVLQRFAALARAVPEAELVVANDGSLRAALEAQTQALGLQGRVRFLGRLNAEQQAAEYAAAQFFLSLPESDSVAVSVLEAMAQGCLPILSALPANRELQAAGPGVLVDEDLGDWATALKALQPQAAELGQRNRDWVAAHGLFAPAVHGFLARLRRFS